MSRYHWVILTLAYIGGLLLTGFFGFPNPHPSWLQWGLVILTIGFLTYGTFFFLKRRWRRCPRGQFWVIIALVALGGALYFQLRIPQPHPNDISQLIKEDFRPQTVRVLGQVLSEPRLTNNQRHRFWLKAKKVEMIRQQTPSKLVGGKLYITISLAENQLIYPGQTIIIEGSLYKPRSPKNPGSFDFKNYLAKEGAFAGLKGEKIVFKGPEPFWGWTKLRQRIIKTFTNSLGDRKGLMISSMLLGRRAVDLPPDIRDLFIKSGLAHILAASGFHVALLLGIVLKFTQSLSPKKKLIIGIVVLSFYTGLTGLQPSILRATFMGITILIGETLDRKNNSIGSLGLAGFLLLIMNPLWIWDLSFQLSFLATFGLIVTSPAIQKKLDFLPPKIGSMIAVPVAASIWTSPLIMSVFYSFSFSAVLCNLVTTPLITLIIIGGMITAGVTFISPDLGGSLAQLLALPSDLLLALGQFFPRLSLSSLAVGKISLEILLLIYGLLILICFNKKCQKRWGILSLFMVLLIVTPIVYKNITQLQITILNTRYEPIIIIQERGQVTVINLGDENSIKYTVLPFLSQQGINHITAIIVPNSQEINSLLTLKPDLKVDHFFYSLGKPQENGQRLSSTETIMLDSTKIYLLNTKPFTLKWEIAGQSWLWLNSGNNSYNLTAQDFNQPLDVLLWSGKKLSVNWLEKINPKIVIASTPFISDTLRQQLQNNKIQLYWLQQDGAIQWIPKTGLQPVLGNQEIET
ncbi:ComEC/Rec2 family competence protein [Crocosphaera sp. XPORK-15E]|uniref:ComEC/Rec2 family competence protein n=1 Tax=Crocosphaera sp. XPORK-15E TaxID=3110247 RepID=UPI002B1FE618|nr:ComEC/Rec2 family competence protein [Crocosphaera sp. XPORK-15E]MEA5534886.1 ComEC/Rec2 family competence protein [Crocosphaera sp. XPORK-15E]